MIRRFALLLIALSLVACTGEGAARRTPTASPTLAPSETPLPPPTPALTPTPFTWRATLVLWLDWDDQQLAFLEQVMRTFQGAYPEVYFDVRRIPSEVLQDTYTQETYNGGGPTLLFAPAEWGRAWADEQLVADLAGFAAPDLLATLSPPGVESAAYQGKLINLPYALRGMVLYRNQSIIPQAAANFDEFLTLAQTATHGGVVGADLERGIYYSAAHLYGLGGTLMDEQGNPAFNTEAGLEWLSLLKDFERAGAAELSTERDVRLFKEGKVGWITEGSWKRQELADAIGPANLAIDPWPAVNGGSLSGFVWADSLYLNPNSTREEQAAAFQFISYLLSAEVQSRLAEVGFIPAAQTARPRDVQVQQLIAALKGGVPYPLHPDAPVYWDPLATALYAVFKENAAPAAALLQADDQITTRLLERRTK